MGKQIWTKQDVMKLAKKYKRKIDFAKDWNGARKFAMRHGFWEEATKHMGDYVWNRKKVMRLARKCKTRREFEEASSAAVRYAKKNGFLSEAIKHMKTPRGPRHVKWTEEAILETIDNSASFTDWYVYYNPAYQAALYWSDYETRFKIEFDVREWTKLKAVRESKKYSHLETLKKEQLDLFIYISRNGLFEKCTKHMLDISNESEYISLIKSG